jgi:hypothetical protein
VYLGLVAAFLLVPPLHTIPIKLMALFALSVSVLLTGLMSRRELEVGCQFLYGRVVRLILSH